MSGDLVPVTGAWRPGDDVGHRQFFTFATDRGFALDCGETLRNVTLAYETWGELASDASNAVLLCHAWTGDSHAAGPAGRGHPTPGWWDGFVGPGKAIDTDRWFVVCPNVLGGCQGSTGPASASPVDGKPFGSRFPVITIRDMVRAQARLADHLGVGAWHTVIGGSMGGMQVLEWGVMYPDRVRGLVPIAACMQATAQQIAWGSIGRRVIALDPRWRGGDYYDAAPGDGPARRIGDRSDGRSGHVPQRQRVHRAIRPSDRPSSRTRRPSRPLAAVRGRALPRSPRHEARAPLRCQQLSRHRQGDGPPRPRPRPRQPRGGDVADQRPGAVDRDLLRHALPDVSAAVSSSSCWHRSAAPPVTPNSTHRTATTPSSSISIGWRIRWRTSWTAGSFRSVVRQSQVGPVLRTLAIARSLRRR